MHRTLLGFALFLAATISSATRVLAWGDDGHVAVCEIAFLELDAATQQKVNALMTTDPTFATFPTACTWPDMDKRKKGTIQNKRRPEHFINVPRNLRAITTADCGPSGVCLFTAIHDDSDALKPGSGKDRLQALKFLGHWMGDLHQPLHISFEDDTGGNDIPVQGLSPCHELHGVWDTCIPDDLMKQLGASTGVDLGIKLQATITAQERAAWRTGSPVEWAEESYAITLTKDTDYCTIKGKQCCYTTTACKHAKNGALHNLSLTGAYDDQHTDIVKERIQRAGVRLAKVLDDSLQ